MGGWGGTCCGCWRWRGFGGLGRADVEGDRLRLGVWLGRRECEWSPWDELEGARVELAHGGRIRVISVISSHFFISADLVIHVPRRRARRRPAHSRHSRQRPTCKTRTFLRRPRRAVTSHRHRHPPRDRPRRTPRRTSRAAPPRRSRHPGHRHPRSQCPEDPPHPPLSTGHQSVAHTSRPPMAEEQRPLCPARRPRSALCVAVRPHVHSLPPRRARTTTSDPYYHNHPPQARPRSAQGLHRPGVAAQVTMAPGRLLSPCFTALRPASSRIVRLYALHICTLDSQSCGQAFLCPRS